MPGLRMEDFEVYEDGKRQTISQFDSERVPVSLGIVLDASGSMAGEKMSAAKRAVNRFLERAARAAGRGLSIPLRQSRQRC